MLQVVAAVAYASDSFVIAQLLGAPAVAEYAVPERMFSLITMVLAMVLAPLWPAYGEAIARGDAAWVKRTLKRSILTAVGLAALCSFTLVLVGEWVIPRLGRRCGAAGAAAARRPGGVEDDRGRRQRAGRLPQRRATWCAARS